MKHLAIAAFLLIPFAALAQTTTTAHDEHADHAMPQTTMAAAPQPAPVPAPAPPVWAKQAVEKAIRDLPPDQITADLSAVADYVSKLPAANGKVAVAGFCWGGTQSFRFATNRPSLAAAFIFYGTGPESPDTIAAIKAPVYGFYAGNDARVGATVPKTMEMMTAAKKTYEIVTYEGAGHGFMRAGEAPDASPANKKARDESWARWKTLLGKL